MHRHIIVSGDDALATTIADELKSAGAMVVRLISSDQSEAGVARELVLAAVVPADRAAAPTLEELRAQVMRTLDHTAAPRELLIVDALPLRGIGKVDRSALRMRITGHTG